MVAETMWSSIGLVDVAIEMGDVGGLLEGSVEVVAADASISSNVRGLEPVTVIVVAEKLEYVKVKTETTKFGRVLVPVVKFIVEVVDTACSTAGVVAESVAGSVAVVAAEDTVEVKVVVNTVVDISEVIVVSIVSVMT